MKKIRILAVCPYSGLDAIIKNVLPEFPQIEVIFEFGQLDTGVQIAQQYVDGRVDAVISRGGTARKIASAIKIPTFDIGITTNDLITTITLAKNTNCQKMCLVGFYEVTTAMRYLDRLLDRPLPVFVTMNEQEHIKLMHKLKQDNYELVIGDATAVKFAASEGLNNIMITSGEDSVRKCLSTIGALFDMSREEKDLVSLQRSVLKNLDITFFVVSSANQIIHSQIASQDLLLIDSNLMQQLSISYVKQFRMEAVWHKAYHEAGNETWLLSFKTDLFKDESIVVVTWQRLNRASYRLKSLLTDASHSSYPIQMETLKCQDEKMKQAISDAKSFAQGNSPILISGEPFTGREPMAHMIYNLSSFGKSGFFVLDAKKLTEENLRELFESPNSFLTALSLTLAVRNLQTIDKNLAKLFLYYVGHSSFCQHSRLICIFDSLTESPKEEDVALNRYLLSNLGSLLIAIPSLRERQGDLILLATLALGEFCREYGKDCIGFTKEAQDFILRQHWRGNQHELRGVIRQVTATLPAQCEYIEEEMLERELKKWTALYTGTDSGASSFLQGTLEEIENKIILAVLKEEGGHKTRVTKRLNISRNTLWRKLKELGVD